MLLFVPLLLTGAAASVVEEFGSLGALPGGAPRFVQETGTLKAATAAEEIGALPKVAAKKAPAGGKAFEVQGLNLHLASRPGRQEFLRARGETNPQAEHWNANIRPSASDQEVKDACSDTRCAHVTTGALRFAEFVGTLEEVQEWSNAHSATIESYEPDGERHAMRSLAAGDPEEATWGLARIGNNFQPNRGRGVHVYVMDTGIRVTHNEFGGRAIPTYESLYEAIECYPGYWSSCATDADGHGTHCAGTVGGKSTGVAPLSVLHAVKVLGDDGTGFGSWSYKAMNWIAQNAIKPAVVSASLGGAGKLNGDKVATDALVAAGITVVVAAGNEAADACDFSPAFVPSAITVGALNERDHLASFSNYGTCVDMHAPGTNVESLGRKSDTDYKKMSGTSMACPHVSGAAALLLEADPSLTPDKVQERLVVTSERMGLAGDSKLSTRITLRVGGRQDWQGCDNNPRGYTDSWSFPCWAWGIFSCESALVFPYTPKALVDVRANCRGSCSMCEA